MNIENICMEFGTEILFENANVYIKPNLKVGIVGINGAGKSTLFKIIMKKLEPTSGRVTMSKNTRIGFLPQVISDEIPTMDISVFDFLLSGRPIKKLEQELKEEYEKASTETDEKRINFIMKQISLIQDKLAYYDEYEAESILLKIISGMNINDNLLDMNLNNLSGGQKSKIAFARLLYSNPEILLLDEPTNHLDIETKDYIINYLKNYKGTILVISHDIEFLDAVTDSTLYINKATHQMELFPGNYEKYQKIKTEREESQLKLLEKQEKEEEKLKKVIAKYIRGNEKKANIAKDRQKKLLKLEKEKVIVEKKNKTTTFKITTNHEGGTIPLRIKDLCFGYNEKTEIIHKLSFELSKNEKFLIVGENGVGKSTLLKLICNTLHPNSGTIEVNPKSEIAYYAQEHELLEKNKTILENFENQGKSIQELRSLLGSFLFFGDDIYKKVSVLSPGERSRVALAKIAISGANFLILDEPTNHLDPETQKIISDTFKTFNGTMLVVSHNIDFVDNLGIERILMLPSGDIRYYDKKTVEYHYNLDKK